MALSLDGGGESGGDSLAEKSIHKLALREVRLSFLLSNVYLQLNMVGFFYILMYQTN